MKNYEVKVQSSPVQSGPVQSSEYRLPESMKQWLHGSSVDWTPAKTNLQDHAIIFARILHARLAWHVHAICLFSWTILHNILHQFLQDLAKKSARNSKLTGNYSCSISCKILHHFLQESCKIVQESCKFVQEKGHRVHVPSKSCMQDSCKILA